jgi:hypothetical protein
MEGTEKPHEEGDQIGRAESRIKMMHSALMYWRLLYEGSVVHVPRILTEKHPSQYGILQITGR